MEREFRMIQKNTNMSHTHNKGDQVIITRGGRLHGRTGEVVSVNRSEACASLDILHVDLGNMRVPCFPDQVKPNQHEQ